jgi:hypothetical protein
LGITCLVVNPADIPSSHKDEVYKTDSHDSRGIGQALAKGQLCGIYPPQFIRKPTELWAGNEKNLAGSGAFKRKKLIFFTPSKGLYT